MPVTSSHSNRFRFEIFSFPTSLDTIRKGGWLSDVRIRSWIHTVESGVRTMVKFSALCHSISTTTKVTPISRRTVNLNFLLLEMLYRFIVYLLIRNKVNNIVLKSVYQMFRKSEFAYTIL